MEWHTESYEETERIGAEIAAMLQPGDILLLQGDLGAGKTTLVRGICQALGAKDHVSSPTFVIATEYRGAPMPLYHMDLYRLVSMEGDEEIIEDHTAPDAITFIEWPEVAKGTVSATHRVEIAHRGEDRRTIQLEQLS